MGVLRKGTSAMEVARERDALGVAFEALRGLGESFDRKRERRRFRALGDAIQQLAVGPYEEAFLVALKGEGIDFTDSPFGDKFDESWVEWLTRAAKK